MYDPYLSSHDKFLTGILDAEQRHEWLPWVVLAAMGLFRRGR